MVLHVLMISCDSAGLARLRTRSGLANVKSDIVAVVQTNNIVVVLSEKNSCVVEK